ncbi:MAG: DUF4349 domain-containing protein [Cytophagaceae bacterium]
MKSNSVLLLFIGILCASCSRYGTATYSSPGISGSYETVLGYQGSTVTGLAYNEQSSFTTSNYSNRKVIFDASLTLIVKQPDSVSLKLADIAKKFGGYVVESGTSSTQIRIESSRMSEAIGDISTLGKMQDKYIQGQDVTDEYEDLDIRLQNAERARKKYLELLDKAQNVAEGVQVEKELERLNGEIDLLKGKLNRMEHLVKYSTITVRLQQKKILGPLGLISVGIYKVVKVLFVIKG